MYALDLMMRGVIDIPMQGWAFRSLKKSSLVRLKCIEFYFLHVSSYYAHHLFFLTPSHKHAKQVRLDCMMVDWRRFQSNVTYRIIHLLEPPHSPFPSVYAHDAFQGIIFSASETPLRLTVLDSTRTTLSPFLRFMESDTYASENQYLMF